MTIYLELFLTFLKIGVVSFGGGYAMISLIRDDCLSKGWLTESEIMNFIAVSESTPGPIAINMATFVGSSQAGVLGALVATAGVVLPSFIIILLIASVFTRLLKYAGVKSVISGIKPTVIGLIVGTSVIMFTNVIFGMENVGSNMYFDWKSLIILAIVAMIYYLSPHVLKKPCSPIILIIISGILGFLFFGI